MIKRVSVTQRKELKKKKEDRNKLDKLIKALIKKGIISKEDMS